MERHVISSNATVIDALGKLNALSGGVMTLFVTDRRGVMCGTLTDGDIRRGLLGGARLEDEVGKVMHRNFKALTGGRIDVALMREFRRRQIRLIPVLDREGHITEIIDTSATHTRLPVSAILMAGGKGERLRPMTLDTPKPLLKIGGKAIIDYNIEALAKVGVTDITVTTNYLADKIERHFARPCGGVEVKCVRETSPLGTIGSAALISHPRGGDTIIMNSDLLTTISFEEMYLKHQEENADVTIAAIPYNISVPYAILGTEGADVVSLEEKPSYSYYANAGIYIFANSILDKLKPDTRTDATDLIERCIDEGRKVVYFPINGTWIDIGSPVDFRHAEELMRHHKDLTD